MKPTLLDMTQEILSAMSSDEVNSISDTTESMQVATIIKRKFYDIVPRAQLTEHNKLFQLTPSLDSTKPTVMYLPSNINEVDWIKYYNSDLDSTNTAYGYTEVSILPVDHFMDYITGYNTGETDTGSYTFSNTINGVTTDYTFYFKNNSQPNYCTVLSDDVVIFDSYDSDEDTTLQASKTMCRGTFSPEFRMVDTFIPELDEDQFSLLINEAKSLAFFELKQQPHQLADREARRQWVTTSKNKNKSGVPTDFDNLPDFGRRGNFNYSRTGIFK